MTSDGSLWERNAYELSQQLAASSPSAEAPPLQQEACTAAAAAAAAPSEGGDASSFRLGASRIWFGCPEDSEVQRRVLPCGVVVRETLSGRLEVLMPVSVGVRMGGSCK